MVVPLGEHGVVVSAGPGADTFDEGTRDLAGVLAANVEAALDRAERERRLRNRERELERQNERLDEFASVVSHDLRTPLSVARGHLDLARQDDDREALAKVADAHERMDALVDDLLALAREGRVVGDTEPVDVGAAVEAAWPAHEAGNATLTVADPGTVDADRERLEQLLENLLGNALEHGGDDVAVEVGSLAGEGHRDGFYVTDDGPGVPAADRDSVFERGFTTADDGIGFGLAIVREIATAHGWSVDLVESASGGARFEIRTR
jgi:signal transduction histidine kinase